MQTRTVTRDASTRMHGGEPLAQLAMPPTLDRQRTLPETLESIRGRVQVRAEIERATFDRASQPTPAIREPLEQRAAIRHDQLPSLRGRRSAAIRGEITQRDVDSCPTADTIGIAQAAIARVSPS